VSLSVAFEKEGSDVFVEAPISLHWTRLSNTYGVELREDNDYRNAHRLKTPLRLVAQRLKGRTVAVLAAGESRVPVPPHTFPRDLAHEFKASARFKAGIANDQFRARISLNADLPWQLTPSGRELKIELKRAEFTSISTMGLELHLSLIFRQSSRSARPLEFEWGMPGTFSSQFESKRSRH